MAESKSTKEIDTIGESEEVAPRGASSGNHC
jgi:hypothetical protein